MENLLAVLLGSSPAALPLGTGPEGKEGSTDQTGAFAALWAQILSSGEEQQGSSAQLSNPSSPGFSEAISLLELLLSVKTGGEREPEKSGESQDEDLVDQVLPDLQEIFGQYQGLDRVELRQVLSELSPEQLEKIQKVMGSWTNSQQEPDITKLLAMLHAGVEPEALAVRPPANLDQIQETPKLPSHSQPKEPLEPLGEEKEVKEAPIKEALSKVSRETTPQTSKDSHGETSGEIARETSSPATGWKQVQPPDSEGTVEDSQPARRISESSGEPGEKTGQPARSSQASTDPPLAQPEASGESTELPGNASKALATEDQHDSAEASNSDRSSEPSAAQQFRTESEHHAATPVQEVEKSQKGQNRKAGLETKVASEAAAAKEVMQGTESLSPRPMTSESKSTQDPVTPNVVGQHSEVEVKKTQLRPESMQRTEVKSPETKTQVGSKETQRPDTVQRVPQGLEQGPRLNVGELYLGRHSNLILLEEKGGLKEVSRLSDGGQADPDSMLSKLTPDSIPRVAEGVRNPVPTEVVRGRFPGVIEQEIVKFSSANTEGDSKVVRIKLVPAELGEVRVELILKEGKVSAQLQAQQGATRELISANLQQLRTALVNQGVQVNEVSLSQNASQMSWQGHSGRRSQLSEERRDSRRLVIEDEEEFPFGEISLRPPAFTGFRYGSGLDLKM